MNKNELTPDQIADIALNRFKYGEMPPKEFVEFLRPAMESLSRKLDEQTPDVKHT